jgi:hypothetical protein
MARRPTIACVLKSGGEYTAAHVTWLQRQIERWAPEADFMCLSDIYVPGCRCICLNHNYPGWWSKLELCRPDIKGDILYFDLDTVITGPIDELIKVARTTFLRDVYRGGNALQSSIMYLTEEARTWAWECWKSKPRVWMNECGMQGDQGYFERVIRKVDRWQDVLPGTLVSYKVDMHNKHKQLAAPPPGASVVVFHGKPRPWNVKADWIPEIEHAEASVA